MKRVASALPMTIIARGPAGAEVQRDQRLGRDGAAVDRLRDGRGRAQHDVVATRGAATGGDDPVHRTGRGDEHILGQLRQRGLRLDHQAQRLDPQQGGDVGLQAADEVVQIDGLQKADHRAMDDGRARLVVEGGRDDVLMRVFQPSEPILQRGHRPAADVDDILAQLGVTGADKGAHDVGIAQNGLGIGEDAVPDLRLEP